MAESTMPDVQPYVDACVMNLAAGSSPVRPEQIIAPRVDVEAAVGAALTKYLQDYLAGPPPPVEAPLVVTGIDPVSAEVGSPDLTLHVFGGGFSEATVILFNNGEEPTVFVSDVEVTTIVKPSTASGPVVVPIGVVGAAETFPFEFTDSGVSAATASAAPRRRR